MTFTLDIMTGDYLKLFDGDYLVTDIHKSDSLVTIRKADSSEIVRYISLINAREYKRRWRDDFCP